MLWLYVQRNNGVAFVLWLRGDVQGKRFYNAAVLNLCTPLRSHPNILPLPVLARGLWFVFTRNNLPGLHRDLLPAEWKDSKAFPRWKKGVFFVRWCNSTLLPRTTKGKFNCNKNCAVLMITWTLVLPSTCTVAWEGEDFYGHAWLWIWQFYACKTTTQHQQGENKLENGGNLDLLCFGSLCSAGPEWTHRSDAFPRRSIRHRCCISALPQPGEKHLRAWSMVVGRQPVSPPFHSAPLPVSHWSLVTHAAGNSAKDRHQKDHSQGFWTKQENLQHVNLLKKMKHNLNKWDRNLLLYNWWEYNMSLNIRLLQDSCT